MSALWGLAQWEWRCAFMPARRLSTWGPILTRKRARICSLKGLWAAASAREFAGVVDALVILVVNAAQVRQVLFGEDGVAHLMKPGSAVMVSSTISSADAQEIAAALTALNLNMLDAPVSGGAVKAAQGEMTVMASGSEAAFTRLKPVLDAVASNVYRISDTRAQAQPSKSFINCWLACILRRRPKRWRWPRGRYSSGRDV
ncbi:oxidoreductase [Salmonella enterica subsp. enterica serovar Typhimurium]|nr:oxidoreductase [Salmonella enterica subsp. enterica serovar Typhimurium]